MSNYLKVFIILIFIPSSAFGITSYFEEGLDGHQSKINIRNLVIAKNENIILDNYKINDTVLRAMLKNPILPGEEVIINIDWNHHIGDMVERAGYYEGQYNMAQWYPKIAVYDDKGWHADPFHGAKLIQCEGALL